MLSKLNVGTLLEQAVLYLYKLYGLHPVNEEVFYESKEQETKHTKRSINSITEVEVKSGAILRDEGDDSTTQILEDHTVTIIDTDKLDIKPSRATKRATRLKRVDSSKLFNGDVLDPVNGNREDVVPNRQKEIDQKISMDESDSGLR